LLSLSERNRRSSAFIFITTSGAVRAELDKKATYRKVVEAYQRLSFLHGVS
jgi:hypothetical protein